MWNARLLLADTRGRWWTDSELDGWAAEGRRILNLKLRLDVREAGLPCTGGQVDLSAVDGHVLAVGGLLERPVSSLPQGWEQVAGRPVCWVRVGSAARFYPRPPDGPVRVDYCPSSPVLPHWAEAGIPFYVAYRAYNRLGPTQSIPKAERWKAVWDRWLAAMRDIGSQLTVRLARS